MADIKTNANEINVLDLPESRGLEDYRTVIFEKTQGIPYFYELSLLSTKNYTDIKNAETINYIDLKYVSLSNDIDSKTRALWESLNDLSDKQQKYLLLSGGTLTGGLTLPSLTFKDSIKTDRTTITDKDGDFNIDSISGININSSSDSGVNILSSGDGEVNIESDNGLYYTKNGEKSEVATKSYVGEVADSINTTIENLDERKISLYHIPVQFVDGVFDSLTYNECLTLIQEWRNDAYVKHNDIIFTGLSVIQNTGSSLIFSYTYVAVADTNLVTYYVFVTCTLRNNSWDIDVSHVSKNTSNTADLDIALSDQILTTDAAGLKANLQVKVDGNNVQVLGKNDINGEPIVIGSFSVLQSQIIDDVYIEDGHLYITFIVDGFPGTETVDIDLSTFIDVYEPGEFLLIDGQLISLDYNLLKDTLINDKFVLRDEIENQVTTNTVQTITANKAFSGFISCDNIVSTGDSVGSLGGLTARWARLFTKNAQIDSIIPFDSQSSNIGLDYAPFNSGHFRNLLKNGKEVATVEQISDIEGNFLKKEDIEEIETNIAANSELISEIAGRVVDIYKVPDKWFDGQFQNITYEDCREFIEEWRKNSFFQHNNDLFTGATVVVDSDTSFVFSYGFVTTVNNSLTVYYVQVSCVLPVGTEEWIVSVNSTPTTYIDQTALDTTVKKTGDETISGVKDFTGGITKNGDNIPSLEEVKSLIGEGGGGIIPEDVVDIYSDQEIFGLKTFLNPLLFRDERYDINMAIGIEDGLGALYFYGDGDGDGSGIILGEGFILIATDSLFYDNSEVINKKIYDELNWYGTESEYNALTPDPEVTYYIYE